MRKNKIRFSNMHIHTKYETRNTNHKTRHTCNLISVRSSSMHTRHGARTHTHDTRHTFLAH